MLHIDEYFSTARERYRIKLRREAGQEQPWTEDPVLQEWRFCQVHREEDKTTVWFRENIRRHMIGIRAVEACIIFRWFNRIETGELIKDLFFLEGWNSDEAHNRL